MQNNNVGDSRLAGRRILVTGAASGMGRAGAELFARNGATVCVADYHDERATDTVETIRRNGGTAHKLVADLTSVDNAKKIAHDAAELMGGLDGLWAHAGMPSPHGLAGVDFADIERCMNLNVTSTLATVGESIEHLRNGGSSASILLTGSTSGLVGSRLSPIYSVAKFGIVGLAKSLALTLGPDGIRVNAICPGVTETPMMDDFMNDAARAKFLEVVPLRRVAQPEEMATAALWLLSDDASYVTGAAVPVDGGYTAG